MPNHSETPRLAADTTNSVQVNLICSGMMAFYWPIGSATLQILIPPPTLNGMPLHLIRFGGLGGADLPSGQYQLQLVQNPPIPTANDEPNMDGDPNAEVLFRPQGPPYLDPVRFGTGILWSIDIPKPTSVRRARPILKVPGDEGKPFFCGDSDKFGINPATLPGFYVLTYDGVTDPVVLTNLVDGSSSPASFTTKDSVQNIHLYAEPPFVPGGDQGAMVDHIELFDNMFTYQGNPLAVGRTNCAKPFASGYLTPIGMAAVPNDLDLTDMMTLSELGIVAAPFGGFLPATQAVGLRPGTQVVVDPAGCINAWVDGQ
jgi:hypothetical protein